MQRKADERGDRRKGADSVRLTLGISEIPVSLSSFSNEDGALSDIEKIRRQSIVGFSFPKNVSRHNLRRKRK